jgi:hypothetical protein
VVVDAALTHVEAALLASEKKGCEQQHCDYGDLELMSGVKQQAAKVPGVWARLYERPLFRDA